MLITKDQILGWTTKFWLKDQEGWRSLSDERQNVFKLPKPVELLQLHLQDFTMAWVTEYLHRQGPSLVTFCSTLSDTFFCRRSQKGNWLVPPDWVGPAEQQVRLESLKIQLEFITLGGALWCLLCSSTLLAHYGFIFEKRNNKQF